MGYMYYNGKKLNISYQWNERYIDLYAQFSVGSLYYDYPDTVYSSCDLTT